MSDLNSNETLRAFIAVELTDELRAALDAMVVRLKQIGARVGWVRSANLHLTLIFLGELARRRIEAVVRVMDEVAAGLPTFDLAVNGTGSFGSPRAPRVVWAGIPDPPVALMTAQADLTYRLKKIGFEVSGKAFHPHVTLGRVRGRDQGVALTSALASANNTRFGVAPVRRLVLMQSHLDSTGSHYSILHESLLKGVQ